MFDESLITYDDQNINHSFIDPWESYVPPNTNIQDNQPNTPAGDITQTETKEDTNTVSHCDTYNSQTTHTSTNSSLAAEIKSENNTESNSCVFEKNETANFVSNINAVPESHCKTPEELNLTPANNVSCAVESKSPSTDSQPECITHCQPDETKAGDTKDNVSSIIKSQCSQFMCRFAC